MQRYHFRLQRVLEVKEIMQKLRERELGEAVQHFEHEQNAFHQLQHQVTSTDSFLRERLKRTVTAAVMRQYYGYSALLTIQVNQQHEKVGQANDEVRKQKVKLIESYKEREVIDRFKDRHRKEYLNTAIKEEQGIIDEISNSNFFKDKSLISIQI